MLPAQCRSQHARHGPDQVLTPALAETVYMQMNAFSFLVAITTLGLIVELSFVSMLKHASSASKTSSRPLAHPLDIIGWGAALPSHPQQHFPHMQDVPLTKLMC